MSCNYSDRMERSHNHARFDESPRLRRGGTTDSTRKLRAFPNVSHYRDFLLDLLCRICVSRLPARHPVAGEIILDSSVPANWPRFACSSRGDVIFSWQNYVYTLQHNGVTSLNRWQVLFIQIHRTKHLFVSIFKHAGIYCDSVLDRHRKSCETF